MATRIAITAAEFESMVFDVPTELVQGEIVSMNRPGIVHGVICSNVAFLLQQWSRKSSAGIVAVNDTGITTERDPDTVRGADCLFVRADRLPPSGLPEGLLNIPPDLAVEVLSPSDRWRDVLVKVGDYLAVGVLEVWVVSPKERSVQIFRTDEAPVTLNADAKLTSETLLPGFRASVADFFLGV